MISFYASSMWVRVGSFIFILNSLFNCSLLSSNEIRFHLGEFGWVGTSLSLLLSIYLILLLYTYICGSCSGVINSLLVTVLTVVDECLDFGFYDWVNYRSNAGLGETNIRRWLVV